MKKLLFGYIIREETVIQGNNYQNGIVQIKTEGEKVAKGEEIFRYYSNNEEELNNKIADINNQIQEAISGQIDLFSGDVSAIDRQISNKIDGLKNKNEIQEIIEYKKTISTYITKKSSISGDLSNAGSFVSELIEKKKQYENELYSNSEHIIAPISGMISYRVDNLETVLTPNNIESLNKDFLKDLNLNVGQIVSTSNQTGKIINNYECYIATIVDSENAKEAEVGDTVELKLSTQNVINAKIAHIAKQEDDSILIVFKISYDVENLINYRKISFDIIWWEHEGLKVPKDAIVYDNGLSYVVRNRAGYLDKILVNIRYQNEKYCIVTNYNTEELSDLGYTSSQISNMKKISLYDQILINPDLTKIENL